MIHPWNKIRAYLITTAIVLSLSTSMAGSLQDMGLAELAELSRPGFMIGAHITESQVSGKASEIILNNYNQVSVGWRARKGVGAGIG